MKYCLFLLPMLLLVIASGCFSTRARQQERHFMKKYRERIDPGNTIVHAGANFTLEKTPDGHYIRKQYYCETGRLTRRETYIDEARSMLDGPLNTWSDRGTSWIESNYRMNKKNGVWKEFYPLDGRLLLSGFYRDDQKEGLWMEIDTLYQGHLDSGRYENDLREGIWIKRWFESGAREETTYVNGEKQGEYRKYEGDSLIYRRWIRQYIDTMSGEKIYETFDFYPPFRFRGGAENLAKYLSSELNQPELIRQTGITGTAYFLLYFQRDGQIRRVEVINGLSRKVEQACLLAIQRMPKWVPPETSLPPLPHLLAIPVENK